MTFHFAPAIRERVSLIIALAAASGGGKTRSALAIARGLAGGDDSKIAFIDTEAGRALHYAVAPGEQPDADRFAFQHGDLKPPFTPEAYAEAIKAADDTGRFEVIVVDSSSHEWEGEGGLMEMHDANVQAAVERAKSNHKDNWGPFDADRAANTASIGAWKDPKMRHKRFVARLLQCRAHLILCLRADEKLRIEKVEEEGRNGKKYTKTVITQAKDLKPEERWSPICEKRFMYEMTVSLVLSPEKPGIPIPIKLQAQHRAAVPLDQQLSEDTGRQLAAWARGGASPSPQRAQHTNSLAAVDQPAPSTETAAEAPEQVSSGAGAVPTWQDYVDRWAVILSDATDAKQLGAVWNSEAHKRLRRAIIWPNVGEVIPDPLDDLTARVSAKIKFLKPVVPA